MIHSRVGQVMTHVRERMARGDLAAGARLPSVRACAELLRVSKSTVVEAYDRLVAEAEIEARRGSGFYVRSRPRPFELATAAPVLEHEIDPRWVMRQSLDDDRDMLKPGCGWLPASWLPTETLRRALRAEARSDASDLVEYGRPMGFTPLRELLARKLSERDVIVPAHQVLLTDSGTHAIDLACRLLLRPGDTVFVDDPCYFNFLNMLRAHRTNIVGVPYTPRGPDLEAFAKLAETHAPRAYLTNAGLHNPTGATPSAAVQHRLLQLAETHDILLIEDDIFSDFEPEPSPRLAALDGLSRVVLAGSFSKTLSAGIRYGYIVAKPDWMSALVDLKLATSFGNNELSARVAHRLLLDGSYRRHVETIRDRLAQARAEVGGRLRELGFTIWTEPKGGVFLWARLPPGRSAVEVTRRAMAQGVVLAPGDVFSIGQSAPDFLRFNVAQCPPPVFEVLQRALA